MEKDLLRIDDKPGSQPGQRVLRLTGALVLTTVFDFQATVRADQSRYLIIDFSGVPYVDSAGIGALVGAYVTRQNGRGPGVGGSKHPDPERAQNNPRGEIFPRFSIRNRR
jgi:hypothetical protein